MQIAPKKFFLDAQQSHERLLMQVIELRKQAAEIYRSGDFQELTDMAYAIRESHELIKALATEMNKLKDECEKLGCRLYVNSEPTGEGYRTSHCSAKPDVKEMGGMPSRKTDPENWHKLMDFMKIPEAMQGDESGKGPVDFYWPGVVEYCARLQAAGRQLPPGLDMNKKFHIYTLGIRKLKSITIDS
jgi:hypothetical protein